jgi:hypothetical protein
MVREKRNPFIIVLFAILILWVSWGTVACVDPQGNIISSNMTGPQGPQGIQGIKGDTGNITVDLTAYAPLALPTFTGTVTIPTLKLGSVTLTCNGTELNYLSGVTSAIQTQIGLKAPLASPTFTGTVTLPTVTLNGALNVNSQQILGVNLIASNVDAGSASFYGGRLIAAGGGIFTVRGKDNPILPGGFQIYTPNAGSTVDIPRMNISGNISTALVQFTNSTQQWSSYGAGTLTTDANGNITSVSDENMKTNINPFTRGLKAILALSPIKFNFNQKSGLDTQNVYGGLSAQDVAKYIPEAVGVNPDGTLGISDRTIIATLINALKEQQAEIDAINIKLGIKAYDKTVVPDLTGDSLLRSHVSGNVSLALVDKPVLK